MKKCKYCKSEIDKKASICPICKKKQQPSNIIIISLISMLILFIIIVVAVNSIEEEPIIANIGDELICDDYKIVVNSFSYKTGSIDNYTKIPDGEEWIGIIATATNTSKENKTISFSEFNIINSAGEILKPDALTYKVWGVDSFGSPDLIPNGTKNGYISFSNNSTDNSNIVLEFQCDRSLFGGGQIYKINLK